MSAASVAVVVTSGERHEGKAGMVLFAGKLSDPGLSALCLPWCKKALYKYSSVPFPYTGQQSTTDPPHRDMSRCRTTNRRLQQVRNNHHVQNHLTALFRDHPDEPVPEENFWTSWCKGRLTEADTPTIRLGATPSRPTSAHLHHPPFLQAGCPSRRSSSQLAVSKH